MIEFNYIPHINVNQFECVTQQNTHHQHVSNSVAAPKKFSPELYDEIYSIPLICNSVVLPQSFVNDN